MKKVKANVTANVKIWTRSLVVISAISLLAISVFGNAHEALAKRSGGRVGGSAFRSSPSRSAPSAPSNSGYSGSGSSNSFYGGNSGYGNNGGGFFFLPMFFGGGMGGGLFTFLLIAIVAGVIMQAFRGRNGEGITGMDSKVSVAKIQVGLLASARSLQQELTHLALESDTSSVDGLASVARETAISLMRHPEYWVYVSSANENTKFALAEQKFNSLVMSERSKLNAEVLSNVGGRLSQAKTPATLPSQGGLLTEDPSEYIVVTLLLAVSGESISKLPVLRSTADLQSALSAIGSVPADNLLAVEVLWEPQSEEYTLTTDEVLTIYPDLVRI